MFRVVQSFCRKAAKTNAAGLRRFTHGQSSAAKSPQVRIVQTIGIGFGGFLVGYAFNQTTSTILAEELVKDNDFEKWHRTLRIDLPTYKMTEVEKHTTIETGVWITYGLGVYDITKFIPNHPGSDKIMLGAGNAIDPFWHIYQQHNTEQILTLLETFRIGNLPRDEVIDTTDLGSPWANEPKRLSILKSTSKKPFNAEPPLPLLVENYYTPVDFFYVRNHLPVPIIDPKDYELNIEIEESDLCKKLTLDDIKKFPKHTVTAAIMCGGNRRSEMHKIKEVKGLSWNAGAVGNAKWSGARLSDVLLAMGVQSDENKHIIFEGYDTDPTSHPYAASIPLSKGIDERGDVILAYEMNDETLSPDHGYPIRVIVPGVVGARNVKWLGRIVISESESDSHWQQNDYKGFSPSTDWDTVDFTKSPAIQNMPVTSAICYPKDGGVVEKHDGCISVKGYAWSGGGNKIVRVDITLDQGKTWQVAELEQENTPHGRTWGWCLWTAEIPVSENLENAEIWAKAVDSSYNVQPESFANIWNLRGVLSNAYHRVKIQIK